MTTKLTLRLCDFTSLMNQYISGEISQNEFEYLFLWYRVHRIEAEPEQIDLLLSLKAPILINDVKVLLNKLN
ncbi:hypothetical protein [Scytonema sp. NUACC26]|uniref:hypothetical protein n=1 Tax=Scytonema sp. NUACC26 TaxID=3140176 RepID=UPI0034DC1858